MVVVDENDDGIVKTIILTEKKRVNDDDYQIIDGHINLKLHHSNLSSSSTTTTEKSNDQPPIWWSNSIFFVAIHLIGLYGAIFISPINKISSQTIALTILSWQLATFGITIGYHRLWSHRSFEAHIYLRWILALAGCLGFQGSIRWWVLRHRLHHRFTDTENDPYNAKRGLFYSHVGWIFRKPHYDKLKVIDRSDLDRDPVVRFQHQFYIPLSLFMGFILPLLISNHTFKPSTSTIDNQSYSSSIINFLSNSNSSSSSCSGGSFKKLINGTILTTTTDDFNNGFSTDGRDHSRLEAFIWVGIIARLLIWHFTFFINSLAHYLGEQLYDLDITARSSFILAIFTGGEANHNYHHVFPKDYRNGPAVFDWDPTKWMIYLMYRFTPLIRKIHFTKAEEIEWARKKVLRMTSSRINSTDKSLSKFEELNLISSSSSGEEGEGEGENKGDDFIESFSNPIKSRSSLTNKRIDDDKSLKLPRWKRSELVEKLIEYSSSSSSEKTARRMRREFERVDSKMMKRTRRRNIDDLKRMTILLIDNYLIDVSDYVFDHPGGSKLLKKYSIVKLSKDNRMNKIDCRVCGDDDDKEKLSDDEKIVKEKFREVYEFNREDDDEEEEEEEEGLKSKEVEIEIKDCSQEFFLEFNLHSNPAKQKMKSFRIAKLI